jgi:hypothetical protein
MVALVGAARPIPAPAPVEAANLVADGYPSILLLTRNMKQCDTDPLVGTFGLVGAAERFSNRQAER